MSSGDTKDTNTIYRYKFTNEFMTDLYTFSKTHQYDDRHDFKSAWNQWAEENVDQVSEEVRRLTNLGYTDNILDKMFKSARYYFRKKNTAKKEPAKRKKYLTVNRDLIEAMDEHIGITQNCRPSEKFLDFCKNNEEVIKEEIRSLLENGLTNDDILKKIKKTYKNRYFMQITL